MGKKIHNDWVNFSLHYTTLSLANFSKSCFWPISLKKIVAFTSGRLPSRLKTLPNPNRSCSTSIPTWRFVVSEGAKPGVGTCAFAKTDVVLTGGAFGFEKVSPLPLHAARSSSKNGFAPAAGLAVKSSSRYLGSISSRNRLGSQLMSVPNLNLDVA